MEKKLIYPPPFERVDGIPQENQVGDIVLNQRGRILQSSLQYSNFAADIIESYDLFIKNFVPERLRIPFKETDEYEIFFDDVVVRPLENVEGQFMSPDYARNNNRTYEAKVTVSLIRRWKNTDKEDRLPDIDLGNIPIMIGSHLDHSDSSKCDDAAGYFIINGVEYVVMLQQQLRSHQLINVPMKKGDGVEGTVRCLTIDGSYNVKFSTNEKGSILVALDNIKAMGSDSILRINAFHIFNITLPSKFRGNQGVLDYILQFAPARYLERMRHFLERSDVIYDVSKYVPMGTSASLAAFRKTVIFQLFPHITYVPPGSTLIESKLLVLALTLVKYTMACLDSSLIDDRDSWSNSQISTPGMIMSTFLNYLCIKEMSSLRERMEYEEVFEKGTRGKKRKKVKVLKDYDPYIEENSLKIIKLLLPPFLTNKMHSAFAKHSFSYRNGKKQDNATQVLSRKTFLHAKNHINKVVVRSLAKGKILDKRMIHNSQTGYICVVETPEGEKCGLIKGKAITTRVSTQGRKEEIISWLKMFVSPERKVGYVIVLVNYEFVGWAEPHAIHREAIMGRRKGILPRDVAVTREELSVSVMTTGGRPTRPLLIVEDGELLIEKKGLWGRPFSELLDQGVVEYVDALEMDRGRVASLVTDVAEDRDRRLLLAMFIEDFQKGNKDPRSDPSYQMANLKYDTAQYSHCELDPTAILGIPASIIPLSQNNQGPRNTYMCNMASQALGTYTARQGKRFDTEAKFLSFPSRSLMETTTSSTVGLTKYPAGQNIILAVLSYEGFNQEDAYSLNEDSVKRGLFSTVVFKSVSLVLSTGGSSLNEESVNPKNALGGNRRYGDHVYRNLTSEGIPIEGSLVEVGDCLIGAVSYTTVADKMVVVDKSIYANMDQHGVVDAVHVGLNAQREKVIKVRIRRFKKISEGDKIASMSAQKGTIGSIIPYEKIPYTEDGVRPDVIINPNAFPSRMTMAQLLEMLSTTATVVSTGARINATNWSGFDYTSYSKILEEKGYDPMLRTVLYDPRTQKPLQGKAYVGTCYYQVLPHQSESKIQHRGTGAIMQTTRQAVAGRTRKGGIKVGNMEVNALLAYGAVHTANERLCSAGGTHRTIVCDECGTTLSNTASLGGTKHRCRTCGDKGTSACMVKPAAKFFEHVLAGAGIQVRRRLRDEVVVQ